MKRLAMAFVTWLVLLVAMVANGLLRVVVLQPRLGEVLARQLATAIGVAIVLIAAGAFVRRRPHAGSAELLGVGVLWLLLTLAFEFLFGHYVAGASWQELLADYDVLEGRLWPIVLLAVLLAPWLWGLARPERADIQAPRGIV
jgi:hypothetical protein